MGRAKGAGQEEEAGGGHLDRLPPKAITLLFSLIPASGLLALRCCSRAHYARFHAPGAPHWDAVSQRLVVELHSSRLHLATASDICGPPAPALEHEGQDEEEGEGEEAQQQHHHQHQPVPYKRLVARPLVVGHRGASGHRVGNSLESFHHAVALGADMIELDVCIDRSGEVVVHHDNYLKTTGQLLSTLTLPEIKRVAPEVEPLRVVLSELRASGIALYLDLKNGQVVPPLMRILHEAIESGGWHPSRLLIASFNQHDIGIEVNAHRLAYPHTLGSVQTCIIVDGVPISFAKQYQQLGVSWCSIGDGCVLPSFVEDAHSRGIGVMVWTVNNASAMQRYLHLGVDAVVTDYPERFVAVRAQAEQAEAQASPVAGREEAKSGSSNSSSQSSSTPPPPQHGGSPRRPRGDRAHHNGNGNNGSPLLSAYPTPLHQPRKRLVSALRQAWPLLRALEGRRPHASHAPPTPRGADWAARRERLQGFASSPSPTATASAPSDASSSSSSSSGSSKHGGGGLVAHLKAAAQQAEEVATAVLQPRLPHRHRRGNKGREGGGPSPQTPPRAEEGKGEGAACVVVPTACGLTLACGSGEQHQQEEGHDWPFLPFERRWAAQAASYS